MSNDVAGEIASLSIEELGPIASQVLDEHAIPSGPVSVKKIGRSIGDATAGIYRIVGQATTSTEERSWSAVVKALGRPEQRDAGAESMALHEVEVYRSGVFTKVCGGVRAPRCYAIQSRGGLALLWLEDLSAAPQPPWAYHHFITTARHLGRFNAHWPEQELPSWNWLSSGGLRARFRDEHQMFEQLPIQQDHPLVRRFAAPDALRELLQLWDESDVLISHAEGTSRGVCHRDCHPKNLFPMQDSGGSYTVGIDWTTVGIDSFGLDIGQLLASPMTWLEHTSDETQALVDPVFDAYVSGLREEGWSGNQERVRLTFLTRLSFEAIRNTRHITQATVDAAWLKLLEDVLGNPIEEIAARFARARSFYLACKDEALRLARQL
jgi:hypothetical protein